MAIGLDLLVRSFAHFGKNKYAKTPEIFVSANDSVMSMKDQESVFILGGGPSTSSVDFAKYSEIHPIEMLLMKSETTDVTTQQHQLKKQKLARQHTDWITGNQGFSLNELN